MVAVSYLLLISFKLNSRAEQGRGHPRQCEYPRHREQLILSQARCGDVTCHVSRVTQWRDTGHYITQADIMFV